MVRIRKTLIASWAVSVVVLISLSGGCGGNKDTGDAGFGSDDDDGGGGEVGVQLRFELQLQLRLEQRGHLRWWRRRSRGPLHRRGPAVLRPAELHDERQRDGLRPGGGQPALQRRRLRPQRSHGSAHAHQAGHQHLQLVRRVDRRLRHRDHLEGRRHLHADGRAGDHARAARRPDRQVASRGVPPDGQGVHQHSARGLVAHAASGEALGG